MPLVCWHQGSLDRIHTPHKVKSLLATASPAYRIVRHSRCVQALRASPTSTAIVHFPSVLIISSAIAYQILHHISLSVSLERATYHITSRQIHTKSSPSLVSRTNLPLQEDPRCQAQPWRKTVVGRPLKTPPSPTSLFLQLVSQTRPELLVPFSLCCSSHCPDACTRAASSACRWPGAFAVAFGKASSLKRTPVSLFFSFPHYLCDLVHVHRDCRGHTLLCHSLQMPLVSAT